MAEPEKSIEEEVYVWEAPEWDDLSKEQQFIVASNQAIKLKNRDWEMAKECAVKAYTLVLELKNPKYDKDKYAITILKDFNLESPLPLIGGKNPGSLPARQYITPPRFCEYDNRFAGAITDDASTDMYR